jgi:hypothetical protein
MFSEGADAARCSNALTASKFQKATSEEQAIYRKWLRGLVVLYCTLLLAVCTVGFVSFNSGPPQLSKLPANGAAVSLRAD